MSIKKTSGRIKILPDSVSLRIAAGEVIDRPFSIVRELLDNSIDAGSSKIDLYINGGGIDHIRVVDNGRGMSQEDMRICYLPYSTSKINRMEDLDTLKTMGFRGEALSSIAACSKLEVISKIKNNPPNKLIVHSSSKISLNRAAGSKGTVIDVSDLFYSIPARKKFLKKPSAEATACKKTLIEKALPFPDISFRFYSDNKLKIFLPASTLKERFLSAYPGLFNTQLIHETYSEHKDYKLRIIAADPALKRKDRRYIQIFLNNRRINEFALVQAVEYGYSNFIPGGEYPVLFLFIDINPALIDFNIHPAKKEVRFFNLPEIHHSVVDLIKSFLSTFEYNYKKSIDKYTPSVGFSDFNNMFREKNNYYKAGTIQTDNPENSIIEKIQNSTTIIDKTNFKNVKEETSKHQILYMGQLFKLFLLAAIDTNFYFIDQHAAHEKILYNELRSKKHKKQDLLIPFLFELESSKDKLFKQNLKEYQNIGISIENLGNYKWQLISIPELCAGRETIIVDFIKAQKGSASNLEADLYADIACKSAIKDGDTLDNTTAVNLIQQTMELKNARCPHGRPVWFQVSREELFHFVGRL